MVVIVKFRAGTKIMFCSSKTLKTGFSRTWSLSHVQMTYLTLIKFDPMMHRQPNYVLNQHKFFSLYATVFKLSKFLFLNSLIDIKHTHTDIEYI